MVRRVYHLVWLLFLLPLTLFSQTNDYGLWTTVGAEKKFGRFDVAASSELRLQDNVTQIGRWSLQLDGSYKVFKPLKVGLAYEFMYFYDEKYNDFQPRSRYVFYLQGRQKLGNFTFSLRERAQVTTKDESDRIKASGKIDTYKINPEWTWRNRVKVEYNIPKFPVTPSLSFESFYQLNNPDGNTFDKLRYTLSFSYNLTKHHELEVYGLMDKDINVTDPVQMYVTGIGYTFSF